MIAFMLVSLVAFHIRSHVKTAILYFFFNNKDIFVARGSIECIMMVLRSASLMGSQNAPAPLAALCARLWMTL